MLMNNHSGLTNTQLSFSETKRLFNFDNEDKQGDKLTKT